MRRVSRLDSSVLLKVKRLFYDAAKAFAALEESS